MDHAFSSALVLMLLVLDPLGNLPLSIAVIVGTFLVSIWQAGLTWQARAEFAA